MKSLWTITALAGFLSLSIFGLWLMPYSPNHDHRCLAAFINNAKSPCPEEDPMGFANFHGGALKKISLSIAGGLEDLGAAFFAIVLMLGYLFWADGKTGLKFAGPYCYQSVSANPSPPAAELVWLALHENSGPGPAYFR